MRPNCDRCDNQATVHLTEIRGGQKTERHLCENCARSLHVPQAAKELQKLLKSFDPAVTALVKPAKSDNTATCPECGLTWAEFRQRGRFGCARDYDLFANEVERLLKRIHGSARYTGKSPKGALVSGGATLDALSSARKALQTAIEAENYEEAARLRDEIAKLGQSRLPAPDEGS
jgi:protein arginine kinase activator